ncbi:MAG: hypothetical protein IPK39_21755 [Sulfuritalea sp.]|nr:hypothetical protein [Sulfuritalea sp.]
MAGTTEEIRDAWRRGLHLVRNAITELKEQNRCNQALDATYSAFAAIGMCSWICNWFDHAHPESGPEVAATMVNVFLNGLLCPGLDLAVCQTWSSPPPQAYELAARPVSASARPRTLTKDLV